MNEEKVRGGINARDEKSLREAPEPQEKKPLPEKDLIKKNLRQHGQYINKSSLPGKKKQHQRRRDST